MYVYTSYVTMQHFLCNYVEFTTGEKALLQHLENGWFTLVVVFPWTC